MPMAPASANNSHRQIAPGSALASTQAGETKQCRENKGITLHPAVPCVAGSGFGEGVRVWICITLVPGVQVWTPAVFVVQLACTFKGVKLQVVFTGSPEQERLT